MSYTVWVVQLCAQCIYTVSILCWISSCPVVGWLGIPGQTWPPSEIKTTIFALIMGHHLESDVFVAYIEARSRVVIELALMLETKLSNKFKFNMASLQLKQIILNGCEHIW